MAILLASRPSGTLGDTIPEFRALLRLPGEANALVAVKTRLTDGDQAALVWLMLIKPTSRGFLASVFEIPPSFTTVQIGDKFEVPDAELSDWMYNMGGILHGGFSLRGQREQLPPEQRDAFDERIGVTQYF